MSKDSQSEQHLLLSNSLFPRALHNPVFSHTFFFYNTEQTLRKGQSRFHHTHAFLTLTSCS